LVQAPRSLRAGALIVDPLATSVAYTGTEGTPRTFNVDTSEFISIAGASDAATTAATARIYNAAGVNRIAAPLTLTGSGAVSIGVAASTKLFLGATTTAQGRMTGSGEAIVGTGNDLHLISTNSSPDGSLVVLGDINLGREEVDHGWWNRHHRRYLLHAAGEQLGDHRGRLLIRLGRWPEVPMPWAATPISASVARVRSSWPPPVDLGTGVLTLTYGDITGVRAALSGFRHRPGRPGCER